MSSDDSLLSRGRIIHFFLTMLPLLAGAILFLFTIISYNRSKERLFARMESNSQLHGRLVAEQIRGRLSSLDLLLLMLDSRSFRYDLTEEENSLRFYRYLQNRALLLTPVSRLFVLDGEGQLEYSTDRHPCEECIPLYAELYNKHHDQFLSFDVTSWQRDDEYYIIMSRRIDNADGSLSRILAAEIPGSLLFDEIEYSDSMVLKHGVLFNEDGVIFAAYHECDGDYENSDLFSSLGVSHKQLAEYGVNGMVGGIITIFIKNHLSTLTQVQDFSFHLGLHYDMSPQLDTWKSSRLFSLTFIVIGSLLVFFFTLIISNLLREKQRVREEMMDNLERMVEERTRELNKALGEIERLVSYDTLTGALNRRGMIKHLEQYYARIRRYGGSFTLVMCDIDFFKKINDTFGHEEGDKALRYAVSLIEERLRKSDIISRWGGEEFLLYYSEIGHEQAVMLTEKLRRAFEERPWREDYPMTCSFGVATLEEGESPAELIRRADAAMYRAKKTRNAVSE